MIFTLFIPHLKHKTWCVDYNPEKKVTQKLSLAGSRGSCIFAWNGKACISFSSIRFFQNNASGFDSQALLRNSEMFSGGWKKCSPLDSCWRSCGIVRSNVWSELSTFVSDQFLRQSLLGFEAHHRFTAQRSVFVQKSPFFEGLPAAVFFQIYPSSIRSYKDCFYRPFKHLWPQLVSIEVILQHSDHSLNWH